MTFHGKVEVVSGLAVKCQTVVKVTLTFQGVLYSNCSALFYIFLVVLGLLSPVFRAVRHFFAIPYIFTPCIFQVSTPWGIISRTKFWK